MKVWKGMAIAVLVGQVVGQVVWFVTDDLYWNIMSASIVSGWLASYLCPCPWIKKS